MHPAFQYAPTCTVTNTLSKSFLFSLKNLNMIQWSIIIIYKSEISDQKIMSRYNKYKACYYVPKQFDLERYKPNY